MVLISGADQQTSLKNFSLWFSGWLSSSARPGFWVEQRGPGQMLSDGHDGGRTIPEATCVVRLPLIYRCIHGSISPVNLKVTSLEVLVQEECPTLNNNKTCPWL